MFFFFSSCLWGLNDNNILDCKCTLLDHVQFFMHQYPQVHLLRTALNPLIAQTVFMFGITTDQVQELGTWSSTLSNFLRFSLAQLFSLSRAVCMVSLPSIVLTVTLSLLSLTNLNRVHSIKKNKISNLSEWLFEWSPNGYCCLNNENKYVSGRQNLCFERPLTPKKIKQMRSLRRVYIKYAS